jgi:hypothetical protein
MIQKRVINALGGGITTKWSPLRTMEAIDACVGARGSAQGRPEIDCGLS